MKSIDMNCVTDERESSVSNKILTRCWEEDVCLLIMYQQSGSDAAGLNINKKQTY